MFTIDDIRMVVREELEESAKHRGTVIREVGDEFCKRNDQLYTVDEVAERLKMSRWTIYRMTKPNLEGEIQLRPDRIGKHLKFSGWEIQRFLTSRSPVARHVGLRASVGGRGLLDKTA